MTSGLPARVAICAVLVAAWSPLPARAEDPPDGANEPAAERRQVAVISLTADDAVRDLAGQLYSAINLSDGLMIPNRRGFDDALTGPFYDEDAQHLETAHRARAEAEALLDETKAPEATAAARRGEAELAQVTPTGETQALYAELALLSGLAALDQVHAQEANLALALAHRLAPSRQLDPARYPPDTIAAWRRAIASRPATVALAVEGTGRVWIDFVERGAAPGSFADVEVGEHVITVTGADRETWGEALSVTAAATLVVPDAKLRDVAKVQRARLALSRAQAVGDDVARAGAMQQLAGLLGVGDVVMISKRSDGQLQWETWRDRAPGFSAPRPYTRQKPEEMIEGLAGPRKPPPVRQPFIKPVPPLVDPPWYQRRWVQASVAGTVAVAIIGAIVFATRDRTQTFNMDIKGM